MTDAASPLAPELIALLRTPITSPRQRDTPDAFFSRPEISALYQQAQDPEQSREVLLALADLLPSLHPNRAALIALMGGALVEDGADPTLLFPACHTLLSRWLVELEPFCASEVEDDDEEVDPADRAAWQAAQQRLRELPEDQRWQVETLQQAVELLVLPMMAMALRDERNHAELIADRPLQERLHAQSTNDALPFEQLHYLWLASCMSYEDELVVVLPASNRGFVARAHAINNSFHAFTLLQQLIHEHAQALGVRDEIVARRAEIMARMADGHDSDNADFLWLQAHAFSKGELANEMAWAWGEAPLRDNASRNGRRVLIALDKPEGCQRQWSGFTGACHGAQNPHVVFKRYLTPDEVLAYLA